MNRFLTATLTAIATFTIATLTRKGIRKMSVNKPKFTVGDYVRITGVTTVYRIDKVEPVAKLRTGFKYTYHLEGTPETSVYAEDVLEPIDYVNDLDDIDAEIIVPLFDVGDTVQIHGSPEKYHVITAWPEMVYGLTNTETDEYIEMDEYGLQPVEGDEKPFNVGDIKLPLADVMKLAEKHSEEADYMEKGRKLTPREISNQEADKRKAERKERSNKADDLLDLYNGYMKMYEATGDAVYKENAEDAMEKLRKQHL